MSVPAEVAAAYRAGRESWAAGETVNPWNGIGPTARERVLSAVWRRGRCHAHPRRELLDELEALDPLT